MSARYRTIYLVPDPFLNDRVEIGIMVEDSGSVSWVNTRKKPSSIDTNQGSTGLYRALVRRLEAHPTLHPSLGPQMELGEIKTSPLPQKIRRQLRSQGQKENHTAAMSGPYMKQK